MLPREKKIILIKKTQLLKSIRLTVTEMLSQVQKISSFLMTVKQNGITGNLFSKKQEAIR